MQYLQNGDVEYQSPRTVWQQFFHVPLVARWTSSRTANSHLPSTNRLISWLSLVLGASSFAGCIDVSPLGPSDAKRYSAPVFLPNECAWRDPSLALQDVLELPNDMAIATRAYTCPLDAVVADAEPGTNFGGRAMRVLWPDGREEDFYFEGYTFMVCRPHDQPPFECRSGRDFARDILGLSPCEDLPSS